MPDGPERIRLFLVLLKDSFPNNRSEIKRVFANGDYVIVHVHAVREAGARSNAMVDIFKLESGKIVEHWDVIQPAPAKAANDNGMFWWIESNRWNPLKTLKGYPAQSWAILRGLICLIFTTSLSDG